MGSRKQVARLSTKRHERFQRGEERRLGVAESTRESRRAQPVNFSIGNDSDVQTLIGKTIALGDPRPRKATPPPI